MVNRLLLLNGVAIVNVILFHSTGFGFTALFFWAHRYRPVSSPNFDEAGGAAYYTLRLLEQYTAFTIPAFMFVSGFFISVLAGRHREISGAAVSARVRALAVPYLFWSGVILLGGALQGNVYAFPRYVRILLTGASNPNYYYVPLLIQMYVLAPAIVWLARRRWQLLLGATAALQLLMYLLQYPVAAGLQNDLVTELAAMTPKWLFVTHVFWFTLGVVVGFEQPSFKAAAYRWRWHLAAAAVALFVAGTVEWEMLLAASGRSWTENRVTLVDGLYAGAVIFAFLGFSHVRIPFTPALLALGGRSFGIYLAHGVVMEYAARAAYHAAPSMLGWQSLFMPIVIVLGLGVPILLMNLVKRSPARGLYAYVFG